MWPVGVRGVLWIGSSRLVGEFNPAEVQGYYELFEDSDYMYESSYGIQKFYIEGAGVVEIDWDDADENTHDFYPLA